MAGGPYLGWQESELEFQECEGEEGDFVVRLAFQCVAAQVVLGKGGVGVAAERRAAGRATPVHTTCSAPVAYQDTVGTVKNRRKRMRNEMHQ